MAVRTLASLRTEVRQRADMESEDTFLTDAEIDGLIKQSYCAYLDLICDCEGEELSPSQLKSATINTVAGTAVYDLPLDFYRLKGIDADYGGPRPVALQPYRFHDRNRGAGGWGGRFADIRYRVSGKEAAAATPRYRVTLTPTPDSARVLTVWYTPYPDFTLDSNAGRFDGVNGWEEWVVCDAAAKCCEKEETFRADLIKRRDEAGDRIRALAARLDAAHPETMTDVWPGHEGWADDDFWGP